MKKKKNLADVADDVFDKKNKIKENSKKDKSFDKKKGVPEDDKKKKKGKKFSFPLKKAYDIKAAEKKLGIVNT